MKVFFIYFMVVNLISFILMGSDKSLARNGGRRVPENRLFTFANIGGALGSWIGMYLFRHKTKHMSFVIGIPLLFIMNVLICSFVIFHAGIAGRIWLE